jgi:hypothetical protein
MNTCIVQVNKYSFKQMQNAGFVHLNREYKSYSIRIYLKIKFTNMDTFYIFVHQNTKGKNMTNRLIQLIPATRLQELAISNFNEKQNHAIRRR